MRNSNKIENKNVEYLAYISNHISNVKTAWQIIESACVKYNLHSWGKQNSGNAFMIIDGLVESHDQSKYSDAEFDAYRRKFHPTDNEESNEDEFNKAWQHHLSHNLHHWQSMKSNNYNHPYILEYTVEMICDWLAMAMQFGERHRDYYNKNRDSIELMDWQHELIETIYTALDKWVVDKGNITEL